MSWLTRLAAQQRQQTPQVLVAQRRVWLHLGPQHQRLWCLLMP